MKKADYISVLVTLIVGLFSGFYLYTTVFAPAAMQVIEPDQDRILQFSVTGEFYGGCDDACPSFHLLGDASFRYFYTPEGGGKQEVFEGKISKTLQRKIDNVFTIPELERQSQFKKGDDCASYSGESDISYDIFFEDNEYIVDSCSTAADGDSKLWSALNEIWSDITTGGK